MDIQFEWREYSGSGRVFLNCEMKMQFPFEYGLGTEACLSETSIYDGKECQIVESGGERKMIVLDRWTIRTENLASEFDIHALVLSEGFGWTGETLTFLRRLSGLMSLTVSTSQRIDWGDLAALENLERISLFSEVIPREGLDFNCFGKLKECRMTFWENWISILKHPAVEILYLKGVALRKLAPQLRHLISLQIVESPKLTHIENGNLDKLKGLQIAGCKKLKPDWAQMPALEALRLDGKGCFNLEDLVQLKRLKRLYLYDYGRVASVQFVRDIRSLRLFRIGWHTTLAKGDWETLRSIPRLLL